MRSPELSVVERPLLVRIYVFPHLVYHFSREVLQSTYYFVITEDEKLAATLLASLKDRAEHVMLVDLARNDVNRVCRPETVKVDSLMQVEKFSHVMHLTSQVSGVLREGLNRYVLLFWILDLWAVPL